MSQLLRKSRWCVAAVCGAVLSLAGCNMQQLHDQIMGPGFNDEFSKSGDKLRPDNGDGVQHDGLSTKSQQVEDDLYKNGNGG